MGTEKMLKEVLRYHFPVGVVRGNHGELRFGTLDSPPFVLIGGLRTKTVLNPHSNLTGNPNVVGGGGSC